jgi:hypothetical protein
MIKKEGESSAPRGRAHSPSSMAPRNLRKKRVAESDSDDEEDAAAVEQTLQERIEDARTLIKNRAKSKVRAEKKAFPPQP